MILTVTANPSLDLLFRTGRLVMDDANRVDPPRRRPGGQGINLVRAARALGGEARAVAPLGGGVGAELQAALEAEGTPMTVVPIAEETRIFVGVREDATGRSLLLNPRGPVLTQAEVRRLEEITIDVIREQRPAWVACCGSLARGIDTDFYARVGETARMGGARFVPDCDGDALRRALDSGCDLLTPNQHEAGRLLDTTLESFEDAVEAARRLLGRGVPIAMITLGHDGALCATEDGVWHAPAPAVTRPGSAVGAGDAFLAAVLLAAMDDAGPQEILRAGVSAGAASLSSEGADLIDAARVSELAGQVEVSRVA